MHRYSAVHKLLNSLTLLVVNLESIHLQRWYLPLQLKILAHIILVQHALEVWILVLCPGQGSSV